MFADEVSARGDARLRSWLPIRSGHRRQRLHRPTPCPSADGTWLPCFLLVRATSRVDDLRLAGVQLIACDIVDRAGIARAIASLNAAFVFHLAGLVRAMDPQDFMRVNAGGVEAIAQACAEQADPPVLRAGFFARGRGAFEGRAVPRERSADAGLAVRSQQGCR